MKHGHNSVFCAGVMTLMAPVDTMNGNGIHPVAVSAAQVLDNDLTRQMAESFGVQAQAVADKIANTNGKERKEPRYGKVEGVEIHRDPETGEIYASIARIPLLSDPEMSESKVSYLYNAYTVKTGVAGKDGEEIIAQGHVRSAVPKAKAKSLQSVGF